MNTIFKGMPVHYSVYGDGHPLIFLHGFNEHRAVWDEIIPALSGSYRCYTIDLPGFGESPLPGNLTIKYMADAVHRVMEDAGIQKPLIIGHSMGGYVLLELIHHHPSLMSGACLFHSTAFADSEEKIGNRRKTLEFLDRNPPESFLKLFIPGLFSPANAETHLPARADRYITLSNNAIAKAAIQAMIDREDRTDVLRSSRFPWLFIAGKYDQLLPAEQVALQASFCRMAMFGLLPHSGHLGMIEEPNESIELIKKYSGLIFSGLFTTENT